MPREGHASALVDDVIYIFGGRTEVGADLGDLAAFRITTHRWYTFQNMGPSPSPRSGHSMTACGKQIVVLGGEPSTVSRDAQDLTIAYVLDTTKIRYPNDQQVQQSLVGERASSARRPSGGEKGAIGIGRDLSSRDGSTGPDSKRLNNAPLRESVMGAPGIYSRTNSQYGVNGSDRNGIAPSSVQSQGPSQGSKLPRASVMQAPSGPPPQQQAPTPQANGAIPANNLRGKPARPERGFGPAIDTSSAQNLNRTISPDPRESPPNKESPTGNINGRRTPTHQQGKPNSKVSVSEPPASETPRSDGARSASKTRIGRQPGSLDSINESGSKNVTNRPSSPPPPSRQGSHAMARRSSGRNSQTVAILKELEMTKNRNAWYASELELAKKAGYVPNPSSAPILERAAESFDEADRPLIEALIAMRNELANVQGSIDQQAILAAKKIAEVEKQRDAAVSEAVYAKAKLAGYGGSQDSTPQLDNESRDLGTMAADRSNDIAKKLAAALAAQNELRNRADLLTAEVEAEKRGRQLAEDTVNAVQQHLAELESYKQQNGSEVERLKAELHHAQTELREETTVCAESVARAQLLQASKDDLEARHRELLENSKDRNDALESLRAAIAASADVKDLLERKLDEERMQREKVEEKLRKLRAEHEERTAELETSSRKLRDAEDLAEKHAMEARTHRQAVVSGLDKVTTRDISSNVGAFNEDIAAIQAQVEAANTLVRKYQAAADAASEKLRSAEERIAGLEAYQEQASREGLAIRKQLQAAMRDTQTLQATNTEMKHQIANQQLETNAVHVQHSTLKDLLGERGISPVNAARVRNLSSPQNRTDSPDLARLRDLEQQLLTSQQAHDETKQHYEARGQEAEAAYRDKLTQLENDYQSAVHYVKGTEKMIKRMKDELTKCKAENQHMKVELEEAEERSKTAHDAPSNWEAERESLQLTIETLQAEIKNFQNQLELELHRVQMELEASQEERDHIKQSHEKLSSLMQQAKSDLAQLQEENVLLEQRALDAEQKVSLLLDQVETSVDNYRRQSRQAGDSSGVRHVRSHSGHDSISNESIYSPVAPNLDNRNSMALDNLASELETLRAHWETTNKNYRLSNTFDFERTGRIDEEPETGPELSNSLADWRRRLEAEEHEARSSRKTSAERSGSRSANEQSALSPEEANVI